MKNILNTVLALGLLGVVTSAQAGGPAPKSVHDFTMKRIDGKQQKLSAYKGNVVLVVNVASKCGLTPQFEKLQTLYAKYKDKGLRIAAFRGVSGILPFAFWGGASATSEPCAFSLASSRAAPCTWAIISEPCSRPSAYRIRARPTTSSPTTIP